MLDSIKKLFAYSKKCKSISNICGNSTNCHYLSLVLIIKNETQYIREWIEYHKLIGVEHFYIYDNESNDGLKDILSPYIQSGEVTYLCCPGQCMQMPAYNDAIARFKNKNQWLGFIDSDEFIVLAKQQQLPDFLRNYERFSAIGINWIMFDGNGHEKKPSSGFVLSNYTRVHSNKNQASNKCIKSIVNPKLVKNCTNPHFFIMKKGYTVNENCEMISGPMTERNTTNKIQINHYFTKSKEEYLNKISRGRSDITEKRSFNQDYFNFSHHGFTQSTINLNYFINELQNTIPETYREES